ncbi:MAG: O-antigen ligase family protein, partial [Candidatus Limnocylindria bacterium]
RTNGPVLLVGALAFALLVGAVAAARISPLGFVAFGLALVGLTGYVAMRWPRASLVIVVLSPMVDRYIVGDILPPAIETMAHYLSEGMLITVGAVITARALIDGRAREALRTPVTVALTAFVAIGLISAVLNAVPPHVTAAGFAFTLDAAALFFLPRFVGFSLPQLTRAVLTIVAIVFVAAVLAIGQAVLAPDILGLQPYRGRFGEGARLASIFGDPNVFGAFLVAAVPFALFMATHLATARMRRLAGGLAFVLLLALWLSYSRGAWIAVVLGVGVVLAVVDRRALLLGALVAVLTFGAAAILPRNVLVARNDQSVVEPPPLIDSTIDRVGAIGLGGDLRTLFMLNAIPIMRDHPVFGVGLGRYGGAVAMNLGTPVYERYGTDRLFWSPLQRTVDNFWLHLLVEMGLLGFVAFLAAAVIPGLRILSSARHATGWRRIMLGGTAAAAAGMAVSSLTTMLLEANSIGFLFWFLLGVGSLVAIASSTPEGPASAQST